MKRLIMTAIILGTSHGYAQTTNLTFQWHGQTMGLAFEATNLTASVKQAIRDDIAYSMSLIPVTNAVFEVYPPNHPDSAQHTGFARFSSARINYCEGVLFFYKTIGTNICWQIDTDTSTEYLAAIAITNQHAKAVAAFTNYFNQFTGGKIDTSKMTLAQKKALIWNPPLLQKLEDNYGDQLDEMLSGVVPAEPAPPGACPFPPIIAFRIRTDLPADLKPPLLWCEVKYWAEGVYGGPMTFLFCYVNGKWRFSPAGP